MKLTWMCLVKLFLKSLIALFFDSRPVCVLPKLTGHESTSLICSNKNRFILSNGT